MATVMENEYRGVSLKMNDVFVSIDKALPSPSKLDGLDDTEEMALRIIGCESIQDAGKMLKLPQVAIACSQVLYHRFYFSKSFVRHNWEHYAMSCVFLSAKIEECCRRLRDVVNVFVHIRQLREQKILKSLFITEYAELKPHIIKAERRVLKELGFCVHGKHPHKLICIYLHILGQDQNKDLVQLSWNYMNDSLRTTVFCCYQPEIIACACIYLAAVHLQFPLGQNWFEIFGANEETIKTICLDILKLYSFKNINTVALEAKLTQMKKLQMEARNQKVNHDKKRDSASGLNNNSGDNKNRRSEEEADVSGKNKNGGDSKEKENVDRRRSKDHRKRKSDSPRSERKRHRRSRSTARVVRDRSPEDRRKRTLAKEENTVPQKKGRPSSGDNTINNGHKEKLPREKDHRRHRSPTNQHSSTASPERPAQKQQQSSYRKKRRSSSPPSSERQYSKKKSLTVNAPSTTMNTSVSTTTTSVSARHHKQHRHNGTTMYR